MALSKAANRAKTKWNAGRYTQIKISINPDVAAAFKAACARDGRSMAGVLSQHMALYSASASERKHSSADDVSTRKMRKKLIRAFTQRLELVRDAEEKYMSNIPDNLRNSVRYEAAERSVSVMDEVLELLGDVY